LFLFCFYIFCLFKFIFLGSGCNFEVTIKVPIENKNKFLENMKSCNEIKVNVIPESISKGEIGDKFVLVELSNNTSFYNFTTFLFELINSKDILDPQN